MIYIGITKVSYNKSDLRTHSRSSAIMPFDSPYMISYLSTIVSEILSLICENLKTSSEHDHAHSRDSL